MLHYQDGSSFLSHHNTCWNTRPLTSRQTVHGRAILCHTLLNVVRAQQHFLQNSPDCDMTCGSTVRYLECSFNLVLDHLLVGVLSPSGIVCDESGKCRMLRNLTVWISILVKPLCSTTTCKCCTVCQMHVRQFNPCATFQVIRNLQTSLFCVQAQSHRTVQQYWIAQQNEVHPPTFVPTMDNNS